MSEETIKVVCAVREMKLWPDALSDILDAYLKMHPCKAEIEQPKDPQKSWRKEQLGTHYNTLRFQDRKFIWHYFLCPTTGQLLDWTMIGQGLFNGNDFVTHIWASKKFPKNWEEL